MQGEPLDAKRVRELLPENASLAEAVMSWTEVASAGDTQWHAQRTILGQISLVPESVVRGSAGRLRILVSTKLLMIMSVVGVSIYGAFFIFLNTELFTEFIPAITAPKSLPVILFGIGLFLLTGIWHEIGHATALAHEGYAPGRIGLGFLLVIPVLFAEVTAVGMLARGGRLRVDFSGMVFQLFAGGLLLLLSVICGPFASLSGSLQVAGLSSLVAVCWSLLPFVRSDGYWILADYLGVENLDVPWISSGSKSISTAWLMIMFRLANIGFLIFLAVMIPLRLVSLLQFLGWNTKVSDGLETVLLKLGSYLVFGLIWVGLGRHGLKLGQASWQDVCELRSRSIL